MAYNSKTNKVSPWKSGTYCGECGNTRFVLDKELPPRVVNGMEYGPTALPCPKCNANPPMLGD